jgi:hypothetical protein
VGKQHVTLETELRGKGEMVLSRPAAAIATLVLPKDLSGEVLIHRASDETVMAELNKAEGDPVKLAFPGGDYVAYLSSGEEIFKCALFMSARHTTELNTGDCELAAPEVFGVKGELPADNRFEIWSIETGAGHLWSGQDDYNRTLEGFGFEDTEKLIDWRPSFFITGTYHFSRYVSVAVNFHLLDDDDYERWAWDMNHNARLQKFSWQAYALGVYLRGTLPLFNDVLRPYVQAGCGLALGFTDYKDPDKGNDGESHLGYLLGAAAGVQLMPWRYFGWYAEASFVTAPVIGNDVGENHDSGGVLFQLGLRGAM